jgi:hypothetical protein
MNKQKVLKTVQIILEAAAAIAAVWLVVSCTMSMSIAKNNNNATQTTEQTTRVDSTSVLLTPKN